jgi:hypothetical protein
MAVQVRLGSDPGGRAGVLIQWDHHWIVLPPEEAKALATLIYETAAKATEEERPTW